MTSVTDVDPSDRPGAARRRLRAAATTVRDRLAGLRADASGLLARARPTARRLVDGDGSTTRRSALRSVGRVGGGDRLDAEVGDTCDLPRTSDAALPWQTGGWYGGWGGHAYWGTDPGRRRRPVVFVHGNGGDACNFDHVASHLRRRGWAGDALWAITFGRFTPGHDEMRAQIEDFVSHVCAETDAAAVNVVAHSLGVTGVRYWLAGEDRYGAVDRLVGLGGPNHGVCGCPGCEDAAPDADGLAGAKTACREVAPACFRRPHHPLEGLNAGDETPGDVEYVMVRGRLDPLYWCDRRSPYLAGAQNSAVTTGHMGLLEQAAVVRRALAE